MELGNSMFSFGILFLLGVMTSGVEGASSDTSTLATINNELVRLVDNCRPGNATTCPDAHCCTKKALHYPAGYSGDKPLYELKCEPLRAKGEFCYFDSPEQYCPCIHKCHTNGFYGTCL